MKQFQKSHRKVHPFWTLAGGGLGLVVATGVFFYFAVSGEFNPRLVIVASLPLCGVLLFSIFDKRDEKEAINPDEYWDFKGEQEKSKFTSVSPTIDALGIVFSAVLAYLSIYLGEVLVLTDAIMKTSSASSYWKIFTDVFRLILTDESARIYLLRYWGVLTLFLLMVLVSFAWFYLKGKIKSLRVGKGGRKEQTKPIYVDLGRRLTAEEQAKLTYGALLFTRNNLSFDYLCGILPQGRTSVESAQENLVSDWAINNRTDVYNTVASLLSKGNLSQLDRILPSLQNGQAGGAQQAIYDSTCRDFAEFGYTKEEFATIPSLGSWNYERIIHLVRQAYVATYISEEEFWTFIDRTIECARKDYSNWRHYFASYLLARNLYFQRDENLNFHRAVAMKLLTDPQSPYQKYPME